MPPRSTSRTLVRSHVARCIVDERVLRIRWRAKFIISVWLQKSGQESTSRKEKPMAHDDRGRIAILYPGDYGDRTNATTENNRFADLFMGFAAKGIRAEPAVYHDDFCAKVRDQLMQVDGVLVWVNPIQGGRNRSILDSMLREVAAAGIFVSAHPEPSRNSRLLNTS